MKRPSLAKPAVIKWGISQLELLQYREIDKVAKDSEKDRELRRKSLMTRMAEGATVEPGALVPQITVQEARRFTADEVTRILGADVVAEIRTQLAVSVSKSFSVVSAAVADVAIPA
jgi:hypothetical protein